MHTKYSDGRSTVAEMVSAAKAKDLSEVAITDHGPRNIGTGVKNADTYLEVKAEVKQLNHEGEGIKVLVGAEADVIGEGGEIDVPKSIYQQLDLLLVGLHPLVLPCSIGDAVNFVLRHQLSKVFKEMRPKAKNINTKALVEAIHRHRPFAVTHPGLQMPVDVPEVARACVATGTAFEINTGHDYQSVEQVKLAAQEGVQFVINSDAHFTDTVGALEEGLAMLQQAEVPMERILNVVP